MTESGWLTFTTLSDGLNFPGIRRFLTERKCRLFAVACARRIWGYIPDGVSKRIIEALERVADRKITNTKWEAVCEDYEDPDSPSEVEGYARSVVVTCIHDGCLKIASTAADYCRATVRSDSPVRKARKREQEEEREQCNLLRDFFANPLRPVTFSPSWRTDTALSLARQMYESRDFSAMPILADAIQDAGCDSADILDHCRGPGPHVRGCWVVDLVLGKE